MSTPKYNVIYEKLVTDADDLVGLIAYGIYKRHKIEFINKIKTEKGQEPTAEECETFFLTSTTETQLDSYKSQAETILSETVANIAFEQVRAEEEKMLRDYKENIKSCLPSKTRTFWNSVAAGVVSAILVSSTVGLSYFLARTSERETAAIVDRVIEFVQKEPVSEQCPVDTPN